MRAAQIYEYKDISLIWCPFSKLTVVSYLIDDLPNHGFLTRFIVLVKIPSYKMVLNQKTLSYPVIFMPLLHQ